MEITFPLCQAIEVNDFVSKKGTRCGVLRWYDQLQSKVYRTMVFGDDCDKLAGLQSGMTCSIVMAVQASKRDDTVELYLSRIDAPQN